MPCRNPRIVHQIESIHRIKDVSDPKKVAPDGQTIEGRMQTLCVDVAEDIKRCVDTCDTYLKLVVVLVYSLPVPNRGF